MVANKTVTLGKNTVISVGLVISIIGVVYWAVSNVSAIQSQSDNNTSRIDSVEGKLDKFNDTLTQLLIQSTQTSTNVQNIQTDVSDIKKKV